MLRRLSVRTAFLSTVAIVLVQPVAAQTTGGTGAASSASGQSSQSSNGSSTTTVVVQGKRPGDVDKIDRWSYDVKNDPSSQTGVVADVLAKVPSVTVSPRGQVALRGDSNVTIMVNGKEAVAGSAVLQSIPASEVDRIEVITNPSAQYSPDGTAGIINIILKKNRKVGVKGTVSARVGSDGRENASVQETLTSAHWSASLLGTVSDAKTDGKWRGSQTILDTDGQSVASTSSGRDTSDLLARSVTAEVTYKLSPEDSVTMDAQYFGANAPLKNRGHYNYTSSDAALDSDYDEAQVGKLNQFNQYLGATFDRETDSGARLTVTAGHTQTGTLNANTATDSFTGSSLANWYAHAEKARNDEDEVNGEFEFTDAKGGDLTAGFDLDRLSSFIRDSNAYFAEGSSFDSGTIPFNATRGTYAAYATYQQPLGKVTLLYGLRAEQEDIDLRSSGGQASSNKLRFFPSLHFSYDLSSKTKVKLSYSRRIDRPMLSLFNPAQIVATPRTISQGNPGLLPSLTDSYEASYNYNAKAFNYVLSAYYRSSSNVWHAYSTVINGDEILSQQENAGKENKLGFEATFKGQLNSQLKYALNNNLYIDKLVFNDGSNESLKGHLTYSGNAVFEYDRPGGDQYQMNASYNGRTYFIQGYEAGSAGLDFNYSHALTKRVTLTISATDVFASKISTIVTTTEALRAKTVRLPTDQALKIGLSYKFGALK